LTTGARYYFVYPDCLAHQPKLKLFRDWIERGRL
jgi:LysR family transcriptional regulator, glycine cleavage system transcriptional activator